jgi:hypothetical protein
VNFAVNCIATNSIVDFAVNYFEGVLGKDYGIVGIVGVLGKVNDVVAKKRL